LELAASQLRLTNAPKLTDRLVEDLGVRTMAYVEFVAVTEHEFGISIPNEESDKIQTLADLATYLKNAAPVTLAGVFQMRLVADERSDQTEALTPVSFRPSPRRAESLHVEKRVLLDQTALQRAAVMTDNLGSPEIAFELTATGRTAFAAITKTNINRRLALVLEGRLYTAPYIRQEITGGQGMITGDFTKDEAVAIVQAINQQLKP
jgi:acyl carrier protein